MLRIFIPLLLGFLLSPLITKAQNPTLVDSLEHIVDTTGNDSLKAKALFGLTWQHLRYDLPKSREFATQALALTRKMEDSIGMHRVFHYWGLIHRLESNYDSSLSYFQRVVDFYTRKGEEERTLQALFNMGVVNSFRGFYDRSLAHYVEALRIAEQEGDQYMVAEALNSMGIIHKKLENYPKALDMTREALKLAHEMGDSSQQANYLSNLGGLYGEMGMPDSALLYYKLTYAIDSAQNMQWGIGHQLNNIGQVYLVLGDYDLADAYLQRGLNVREELGQRKEIGESLVKLASLRLQQGRGNAAISYSKRAENMAREIGDRPLLRDAWDILAKSQNLTGDFQQAYHSLSAYIKLKDSILSERTAEQINSLQIQYETEKKEKEIVVLTKDKELQASIIQRKNTTIRAWIAIFILALLTLILLFLFFRTRFRHQKELSRQREILHQQEIQQLEREQKMVAMEAMLTGQEEERKRIAADLHDGLGSMLANLHLQFSSVQNGLPNHSQATFQTVYNQLGEAYGEVRKIAHNMMPSVLTRSGLVDTLWEMKRQLQQNKELQVDVQVYGIQERLAEKIEITLYRIIQELLNNIGKHAQATEVIIQLARHGSELNLLVEDNGVGFDLQEVKGKRGLGLGSLDSRVRYLDGSWEIDTAPGRGTSVMIHVDLEGEQEVVALN